MPSTSPRMPPFWRGDLARAALCAAAVSALAGCGGDDITEVDGIHGLRFVTQVGTVSVDEDFTLLIELLDADGRRANTATEVVTLSATGATLSGTLTVAAVEGLAAFSGLRFTSAGQAVTLSAAAAGRSVTTSPFIAAPACVPVTLEVPGSVADAISDASCFLDGVHAAVFRFQVTQPGATFFSTSAAFDVSVGVTTEPVSDNVIFFGNSGDTLAGEWLLPPGTYLFRVSALEGSGAFSLSASSAAGDQGCEPRALVVSHALTQSLDEGDCVLQVDGSLYDVFYIFSTQPCTVTMRSTAVNSYLFAIDAVTNAIRGEDDNAGGGPSANDARLSLERCSSGDNAMGIIANTYPGEVGAYTLTLEIPGTAEAAATSSSLPRNASTDRRTGAPGAVSGY